MLTQIYRVENISCEHCVHTIERELKMVKGVQAVQADLETKKVTVTVEAAPALGTVESTLTEIGYPGQK